MPGIFRAALYWAPPPGDPLSRAGATWLGRDPERNRDVHHEDPAQSDITAAPRLYGFHATLRPPMRLATGWPEFLGAAARVAAATASFPLPPLAIADLDGFLALRETQPCPPLHALADHAIRETNRHRLPPDRAELSRRHAARLSIEEAALLEAWGYPYVLQRWQFHLTLTRRLTKAEHDIWAPRARRHFAAALALPRRVSDLAIFTQREPGGPFLLAERLALKPQAGATIPPS